MVYVNKIKSINDKTLESLNPAIPAQPEMVGQETPSVNEEEVVETTNAEKPKRNRKKNKENE